MSRKLQGEGHTLDFHRSVVIIIILEFRDSERERNIRL